MVGIRPSGAIAPRRKVDGAQQLVGGGHRGAFVAAAHGQCFVVAVALAIPCARGPVGALDEDASEERVALSGFARAFFPGASLIGVSPKCAPTDRECATREGSRYNAGLQELIPHRAEPRAASGRGRFKAHRSGNKSAAKPVDGSGGTTTATTSREQLDARNPSYPPRPGPYRP